MTNPYMQGTTAYDLYEVLYKFRDEYPTGDKGTIIFAREVLEVLSENFLQDDAARICG